MAFASPHITAYAVEATEFPDLARRYMVNGVPKTVVERARSRFWAPFRRTISSSRPCSSRRRPS